MREDTLTAVEIMTLADGKYTIYQRKDGSTFATRHNAYWLDLVGDHLIANLVQRVQDLEEAIKPLAQLDLRPDGFDKRPDEQVVYARDNSTIKVGDVRRAAGLLK